MVSSSKHIPYLIVLNFTNCMKLILEETRSIIYKFQKNIVKYYNQRYISALVITNKLLTGYDTWTE